VAASQGRSSAGPAPVLPALAIPARCPNTPGETSLLATISARCPDTPGATSLLATIPARCPDTPGETPLLATIPARCPDTPGATSLLATLASVDSAGARLHAGRAPPGAASVRGYPQAAAAPALAEQRALASAGVTGAPAAGGPGREAVPDQRPGPRRPPRDRPPPSAVGQSVAEGASGRRLAPTVASTWEVAPAGRPLLSRAAGLPVTWAGAPAWARAGLRAAACWWSTPTSSCSGCPRAIPGRR